MTFLSLSARLVATLGALVAASTSHAQLSCPDNPRQNLLEKAVDELDPSKIKSAVKAGGSIHCQYGNSGRTILGRLGMMTFLSSNAPVSHETEERAIAAYDALFETGTVIGVADSDILQSPAIAGSVRVTKYLLERGANPNGDDGNGNTPLTLATEYRHPDVVEALVAGGASPIDAITTAQILMIEAAERGDLIALKEELKRGADVNRKSPGGESALVEAIRGGIYSGGHLLVVRELLRLGASPNLPGRFIADCSPLHAAVYANESQFIESNGPSIVKVLLAAGAHVSSTDFYKNQTPLHLAARSSNLKGAMLLLEAGAKVMPRDEDGKTPLDYAEAGEVIRLLKSAGAKE